jgi:hypothetical protein
MGYGEGRFTCGWNGPCPERTQLDGWASKLPGRVRGRALVDRINPLSHRTTHGDDTPRTACARLEGSSRALKLRLEPAEGRTYPGGVALCACFIDRTAQRGRGAVTGQRAASGKG